jgi:CelD/BcsL family acetyltransferase involved in cellulose biosynthesis
MSTRPVVETISDPQRLADLAPEWDALAAEASLEHPFLTHDWVSAWWEAFGAGRALHVLVVRDAGRAIAIAPLMRGRTRFCGLPLTSLETIGNDHTPRNGFLVPPGRDDAWQALWETLSRRGRGFDLLLLKQLPAGSPTLLAMQRLGRDTGWLEGRWPSLESPWLGPGGADFTAYLNTLSSKYRAYLRNKERRAEKLGDTVLETITSEADLEGALQDGVRIEGSGWKGKEGTAIGCEAATLRFYSLLASRAARRGWLRMHFLRLGERRVAFDYTLRYAHRDYLLKSGYDSEYAAISPSSLLIRGVLEQAFGEQVEEFDFLGGLDAWKTCWTKTSREHEWLYLLPPSLPLRVAHAAKFRLAPRLRQSPVYAAALGALGRRAQPAGAGPGGMGRGSHSHGARQGQPTPQEIA